MSNFHPLHLHLTSLLVTGLTAYHNTRQHRRGRDDTWLLPFLSKHAARVRYSNIIIFIIILPNEAEICALSTNEFACWRYKCCFVLLSCICSFSLRSGNSGTEILLRGNKCIGNRQWSILSCSCNLHFWSVSLLFPKRMLTLHHCHLCTDWILCKISEADVEPVVLL